MDCTLDAGARRDDALPRRAHLRHPQHRRARAGRPGPDLPRLAHAHARRPTRTTRTTSTSTSRAPAACAPATELAGCDGGNATTDPNPSQWRIEVIKVPRRRAADRGDRQRAAPVPQRDDRRASTACRTRRRRRSTRRASNWGPTPDTNSCHDITVYEELDIAAGACEGNGLLIDISDPANPKRIDAVADPLFAYWHGATFSNDGKTVVFTDEWGGGTAARCRATDELELGRQRDLRDRRRQAACSAATTSCRSRRRTRRTASATSRRWCRSPAATSSSRPGTRAACRWSTSPTRRNPVEIGYFDRGPISATALVLGGFWSTYWYNGLTYGSEIARGFDVFDLDADGRPLRERDRGGPGGPGRPPERAAPGPDRVGAQLQRRPGPHGPGHPRG